MNFEMKKKILFTSLTGYPNPNCGGPTRIVYELLRNLDYSKFEPYFLSYDMFKRFSSKEELGFDQKQNIFVKRNLGYKLYENYSIYRKIVTSDLYLKYYFQKRDKYFKKKLKELKYFDIVHCHDTLSANYFVKTRYPKKILTIHSKGSHTGELEQVFNKSNFTASNLKDYLKKEFLSYNEFDIITFPSSAAYNLFLSDLQISEHSSDKIKIIYNGINVNWINSIQPENILEKYKINMQDFDLTLLNVAQHVKPKNIDLIIKSIKILNDKYKIRTLLINIGEGCLTDYYKEIIKENSLENQVRFLGMISNDDVIRLMKSLDIFIQASEKVVFDLVVLEALQSRIKVIVSDEGGNKEIIKDNFNGLLLEELNEEYIADKVFSSINFVSKFDSDSFEQKYSISKMIENYYNLY